MSIFNNKLFHKFVAFFVFILGLFLSNKAVGQVSFTLQPDFFSRIEPTLLNTPNSHVVIQPGAIRLKNKLFLLDSIFGKSKDLWFVEQKKIIFRLNPVIQSSYRMGGGLYQHQALGFQSEGEAGRTFSFEIRYVAHILSQKPFAYSRLDSANIVDHYGLAHRLDNSLYFFNDFRARLTYSPNRFITFTLGKDKNFFGDGYRSFFLSDNAPAYPFFSTTVNVWHFKYMNQVMALQDYLVDSGYTHLRRKYAAMHILSWDATKRLNLNIFEAVVWRMDDTVGHQNIDINYLNPFIFFRPQEYMLGSPDNVLIGIGSRYRIASNTYLYGQFLLDEFYLKEILAGSGWWANKNALQVGVKSFNFLHITNLYVQLEYNQSRPFTFGHDYPLENYGYLLEPLADPLGTNFREGLAIIRYAKSRWQINSVFTIAKYGLEPGGKTVGADIYLSSDNLLNTFGNTIGQGTGVNEFDQKIELSRILNPRWGLAAEASIENSIIFSTTRRQTPYFTFGIKTLLDRDEKLF